MELLVASITGFVIAWLFAMLTVTPSYLIWNNHRDDRYGFLYFLWFLFWLTASLVVILIAASEFENESSQIVSALIGLGYIGYMLKALR